MWWNNLSTVLPIHFIPIVGRGVMRSRKHYAAVGLKLSNSKGELRSRAEVRKKVYFTVVGRKNSRHFLCITFTVISAIVGNDHPNVCVWKNFVQIICKALGCSAKGVGIDSVGANAHNTSHSSCTKGQIGVKGILSSFGVFF